MEKQTKIDLTIIVVVTFLVLGLVLLFNNPFNRLAYDTSINIVLRVLFIGVCGQFAISGLGISIVSLIRKERFSKFGLQMKNLLPALILSLACCIPDFIFRLTQNNVHKWCPFWDVNTTPEALASSFPNNVIAMLITAVCWGFFEGFNYVVIHDKINILCPSKYRFWDWGAFICAVACILIHGAIGVTPKDIVEMLVTLFLIYGMLIVKKETGNAWGCVLIFCVYWNAL